VSRKARAKQLVDLAGGRSLLEITIRRLDSLFSPAEIVVVTQDIQAEATSRVVEPLGPIRVLSEPVGRNTTACVAYAATGEIASGRDPVMAFLPADHYVGDTREFRRVMEAGLGFVEASGGLLTIGIKPSSAATGYGYIRKGEAAGDGGGYPLFKVGEFTEKPDEDRAKAYLDSGEYYWNSGIFIFRASTILGEIDRYVPGVASLFRGLRSTFGGAEERSCLERIYAEVRDISLDYAVMEKTDLGYVLPAEFGWDDLGSWDSFSRYMDRDALGNAVAGRFVGKDSADNVVYSQGPLVVAAGVKDLIIVASGDAVLIVPRGRGQEVKELVDLLEKRGFHEVL
jgi:mannose-1-phosphate guanylyltransferase